MAEVSTIARPYAKAAFEHADRHSALAQWSAALTQVSALLDQPEVKKVIDSPLLSHELKAAVLSDLCGAISSVELGNFFGVMAENKRLPLLPAVSEAFERLKAAREAAIDVEVISAFEVSAEQQAKLAAELKSKWQKDVSLEVAIDPSLIGGVIIRAGDMVIDGSIRGKLARIAEAVNS